VDGDIQRWLGQYDCVDRLNEMIDPDRFVD
jgi:hypothetical protein